MALLDQVSKYKDILLGGISKGLSSIEGGVQKWQDMPSNRIGNTLMKAGGNAVKSFSNYGLSQVPQARQNESLPSYLSRGFQAPINIGKEAIKGLAQPLSLGMYNPQAPTDPLQKAARLGGQFMGYAIPFKAAETVVGGTAANLARLPKVAKYGADLASAGLTFAATTPGSIKERAQAAKEALTPTNLALTALPFMGSIKAELGRDFQAVRKNEPGIYNILGRIGNLSSLKADAYIQESAELPKLTKAMLEEVSPKMASSRQMVALWKKDPQSYMKQAAAFLEDRLVSAKNPELSLGLQSRELKKLPTNTVEPVAQGGFGDINPRAEMLKKYIADNQEQIDKYPTTGAAKIAKKNIKIAQEELQSLSPSKGGASDTGIKPGENLYHFTASKFTDKLKPGEGGAVFTVPSTAQDIQHLQGVGYGYGGESPRTFIGKPTKDLKILDLTKDGLPDEIWRNIDANYKGFVDKYKAMGYDGIRVKDEVSGGVLPNGKKWPMSHETVALFDTGLNKVKMTEQPGFFQGGLQYPKQEITPEMQAIFDANNARLSPSKGGLSEAATKSPTIVTPVEKYKAQLLSTADSSLPQTDTPILADTQTPKTASPLSMGGNESIQVSPQKSNTLNPQENTLLSSQSSQTSEQILPQRKFAQTVEMNKKTPEQMKADLENLRYNPISNTETMAAADKIIKQGESKALEYARTGTDTNANAVALKLIEKYIDAGKFTEANDLVAQVSPRFTKQGQEIQILSTYGRLTPTGAVKYAQQLIDKANKANPRLGLKLTEENTKIISDYAKQVQSLPEGSRDRVVATAQLMQKISDQVPTSIGQKISGFQTLMQLLNPKTAIRNVLGNTIFTGMENASDVVASGVDSVLSLITGKKTTSLPSLSAQAKGFSRGLKEGIQDVQLGIDTSGGVSSQFDLNTKTFTDPILGTLEKVLNYELRVPDRAAYTAAFDGSLKKQMTALGVSKPTPEMIEVAHADGLYRTFQDNSKLAQFFSGVKKTLNKIGTPDGRFGVGDLILKYPKTPANIISRGLDYSPLGFAKGIYEVVRPLFGGKAFDQKSFSETISRAMVGTGLISAGYTLAKNGIITGKSEKDYDIASVQKTTGQGAFKINVDALKRYFASGGRKQDAQNGDTLVSYDWAQPTSLVLAMGANMANGGDLKSGVAAGTDSLQSGVDTITGQPMIKQLTDFASNVKNKGIVGAGRDVFLNSATGFIPSVVRQTANVTDKTQRETYNPSPVMEAVNKVKATIPGVRNTLQPKVDVFGKEMPNYEGSGARRIFDIFLNPAFVSTVKENPGAKEVLDIFQRSGETQQAPRVAPESVKINGQTIKVDPKQYTDYQKYIGTKTDALFNQLVKDPIFQKATDEEKAKLMANALSDINSAAKIELFGNKPKTVSDNVKRIVSTTSLGNVGLTKDGNLKFTGGSIEKPKMTGDRTLDKKLISGYNSDISSQQKDLLTLYESGNMSLEELKTKYNELEKQKIKSASIKKIKVSRVKSTPIKVSRISTKKITITKPKKMGTYGKIKAPKLLGGTNRIDTNGVILKKYKA